MSINGLTNAGSLPALELTMRFAAQRQRLIAHNIANFDTPGFIHKDVSPAAFQRTLAEAVQKRDERGGRGEIEWRETRELVRDDRGDLALNPRSTSGGLLHHDRNNRDIERVMQDLAETTSAFRVAAELHRAGRTMLMDAIQRTR
ncbi:MAG: hypothetical protein AAF747_00420 [Planctomycetota bacterium]